MLSNRIISKRLESGLNWAKNAGILALMYNSWACYKGFSNFKMPVGYYVDGESSFFHAISHKEMHKILDPLYDIPYILGYAAATGFLFGYSNLADKVLNEITFSTAKPDQVVESDEPDAAPAIAVDKNNEGEKEEKESAKKEVSESEVAPESPKDQDAEMTASVEAPEAVVSESPKESDAADRPVHTASIRSMRM